MTLLRQIRCQWRLTVYGPITAVCEQGSVSNSRRVKRWLKACSHPYARPPSNYNSDLGSRDITHTVSLSKCPRLSQPVFDGVLCAAWL